MSRYIALIPAAGAGQRFGSEVPKQYLPLNNRPLLWHTLCTLSSVPVIERVAVVIAPEDEWFEQYDWPMSKLIILRQGGATRAVTVRQGMAALLEQGIADAGDWLLVHDAARCCLGIALVERLIAELATDEVGGLLALPVPDTVKQADEDRRVTRTISRDGLWLAQTPQMFRVDMLQRAFMADPDGLCTDEAAAVEALGHAPALVEGSATNFKVTYPQDLSLAAAILAVQADS